MAARGSSAARKSAAPARPASYPTPVPRPIPSPPPQRRPEERRDAGRQNQPGKRKAPYGKYAVLCCGAFATLLVIVFNYMKVTELTGQNARLKQDLEALESDGKALEARREQVFNLSYVEDRARNALGMVKADKSQVEYLDLSQADLVEIPSQDGGAPAFVGGLFKGLLGGDEEEPESQGEASAEPDGTQPEETPLAPEEIQLTETPAEGSLQSAAGQAAQHFGAILEYLK